MIGRTLLSGTERCSIEIEGRLDPGRARALLPEGLSVREDAGGAEIEMLAFRMSGLAPTGLPWLGTDYGEVLFRLGVEWNGGPAWFVVRCAIDRRAVGAAAAALMRYPVTHVRNIDVDAGASAWRLSAKDGRGEVLDVTLTPNDEPSPPARPVRPVLVGAGGTVWLVPWDETPAPRRRKARVVVEPGSLEREALGAQARWTTAVLHEGRLHRCGVATRPPTGRTRE